MPRIEYNTIPVQGQTLTAQQTAKKPNVNIPPGYTLVLYDPDAVQPSYIHWMATATEDLLPYKGPSPPPGTGTHHYTFALVKGLLPVPQERAPVNATALLGSSQITVEFKVNAPA